MPYYVDENKIFPDRITVATASSSFVCVTSVYQVGATIDASYVTKTLAYTFAVTGPGGATYKIYGGNISTCADEALVKDATAVGATASGGFTVDSVPFNYYRVKLMATSDGTTANVVVTGLAK